MRTALRRARIACDILTASHPSHSRQTSDLTLEPTNTAREHARKDGRRERHLLHLVREVEPEADDDDSSDVDARRAGVDSVHRE